MSDAAKHPGFLLTVAGRDLTRACKSWVFTDSEQKMSHIEVTLANPEQRLSGAFGSDDIIALRFGYEGSFQPMVQFTIKRYGSRQGTSEPLITLTGHDDSDRLSGGKNKGNFEPDMTPREALEDICEAHGLRLKCPVDGPRFRENPISSYDETTPHLFHRLTRMMKAGDAGVDKRPTAALKGSGKRPRRFSGAYDAGEQLPGAGPHMFDSEPGREIDRNRAENHANEAAGQQIKASIQLVGYPTLRAKRTIQILDAGPRESGIYYVDSVTHQWSTDGGYTTTAQLLRGGYGKGGAAAGSPIVWYADPWEPGNIYVGTRKLTGAPQAVFRLGDGGPVRDFEYEEDLQPLRGAGEEGLGDAEGIDLRDRGKPYSEAAWGGKSELGEKLRKQAGQ